MGVEHYLLILLLAIGGIFALKIVKALFFRIILLVAATFFVLYLLM